MQVTHNVTLQLFGFKYGEEVTVWLSKNVDTSVFIEVPEKRVLKQALSFYLKQARAEFRASACL